MKISKFKIEIGFIILAWWFFLFFASILNPFGLNNVSLYFYTGLCLFIFFQLSVFLFAGRNKTSPPGSTHFEGKLEKYFTDMRIFLLLLVSSAIMTIYVSKFWNVILIDGAYNQARQMAFELGEVFTSNIEFIFYLWGVSTVVIYSKFLLVVGVLTGNIFKRNALLSFALVVLSFLFGGGRFILVDLILIYIFLYFYFKYTGYKFPRSHKFVVLTSLFFLAALFIFALFFRNGGLNEEGSGGQLDFISITQESLKQIIIYNIGSFRAFDMSIDYLWTSFGHGVGLHTLSFAHELFTYLAKVVGLNIIPIANQVGLYTKESIYIGGGNEYNALYTGFLSFYLDFYFFGFIVSGVFTGLLLAAVCNKLLRENSMIFMFLSSYIFNGIFLFNISWKFSTLGNILPIIPILLSVYFRQKSLQKFF